jgi:hypothetical protein
VEQFKVPKREAHVRVLLDDGRVLEGEVFAALIGPDGRPGRVLDRLNDAGEEFLAMRTDEERFLLNKSGIVTVELPGTAGDALDEPLDAGHTIAVRLSLAGGTGIVGRLHLIMPPERSRMLDYLNTAERFFPLISEGRVTLVQKRYVMSARDLTGSDD